MKKVFTILLAFISMEVFSQIGGVSISPTGGPPASSAALDISYTNKGFLMPRLTQSQRDSISAPALGLMVFNTTSNCVNIWFGVSWKQVCGDCDFNSPVPGNNGPICANQTLRLTSTSVAGATYQWSGPNGFSDTAQNPVIPNAGTAAAGSYSVVATLNGCSSQAQSTVVTINSTQTPTAGNNGPLCSQQSLTFSASTISGATYTWTGPNGFTASTQNPTLNNATTSSAGTYQVVATANGCVSDTGSTIVSVYSSLPGQPGTISGSTTNLGGAIAITYSISSVNLATSYTWTVPSGANITSGQGDTAITVNFGCSAGGTISVTPNNPCGSNSPSTLSVSTAFVTPGSISGSTAVNNGASLTYSISPVANATGYTWTTSLGTIVSEQGTTSITIDWDTSGIGSVSVTENTTCGSSQAQSTTVDISTQIFSYTGSMQTFTVPSGVTSITVQAYGGRGGGFSGGGGKGAYVEGTFSVSAGQQYKVLVGGPGTYANGDDNAGGGGGTFFTSSSNTPYLIAGGGGGTGYDISYAPSVQDGGSCGTSGCSGSSGNCPNGGGSGGSGGNGGGVPSSCGQGTPGAGGGGLTGNGSQAIGSGYANASGGQAFTNGGAGGVQTCGDGGNGGFGGGGGGGCNGGGGAGGGGYSGGGGGGTWNNGGGGGGSGGGGGCYNSGTNQTLTAGGNSNQDGQLIVSW